MISKAPYLVKKYYSKLIWQLPTEEKTIHLTFDDGPTPGVTGKVLDMLKDNSAKATFFCVGNNVLKYPELFQRIKSEGHAVGNHSMSHTNGWKVSDEVYIDDVMNCQKLIQTSLFRPPYGKIRRAQASLLLPYFKIVMWSLLTRDYDPKVTKEKCLELAISGLNPGSILVFHDSEKAEEKMLFALNGLLNKMNKKGFVSKKINY